MARISHVISKSTAIFGSRLFGAGLLFGVQMLIANLWGAETLGQYLLLVAAINLTAMVLPLGFQVIASYFAAEYATNGRGDLLRGFVGTAVLHVVVLSSLLLAAFMFLPLPQTEWVETLSPVGGAWLAGAVAQSVVFICGGMLVGLRRPLVAFAPDVVVRPLAMIAIVGALAVWEGGATLPFVHLALGLTLVLALNAVGHGVITYRAVNRVPRGSGEGLGTAYARWWRFAAPWVIIAAATDFLFDFDLILISNLMTHEELAVFGVCVRFFVLASFGIGAVYSVFLPDLFASNAGEDKAAFTHRVVQSNLIALAVSVLALIAAAILGPLALSLFGPAFEQGYPALLVLMGGLVIRSAFGPATLVLSLRDRPYAALPVVLGGLITLVVANFVLIPAFGLNGAALAALAALMALSAGWWGMCRAVTGADVSVFAGLKLEAGRPALDAEGQIPDIR
ncbi:lipopolysaccharide biosynthesis protein [Cucumibacter marinus]|uniref:lipopolysaccharide biosynthesis protein n=1 Tax=Cucumibacter marinus TaxID=1121252 RepID=UPI000422DE4A|nr:polysaccharide biosynthesis C-terminal domain-containing protein [Cucumibacter marinus]